MSIETEINRINSNIAATYSALEAKGATMPETQNSDNLAATAASISGGGDADTFVNKEYLITAMKYSEVELTEDMTSSEIIDAISEKYGKITKIYSCGNQYEYITGGWVKDTVDTNDSRNIGYNLNKIVLRTDPTKNHKLSVCTANKINLNGVKAIRFKIEEESTSNRCAPYIRDETNILANINVTSSTSMGCEIDVTEYNDSYFIGVRNWTAEPTSHTTEIFEVELIY